MKTWCNLVLFVVAVACLPGKELTFVNTVIISKTLMHAVNFYF